MTTAESIQAALKKYGKDDPMMIVRRTDHPHVDGDYYYAIRRSEKYAWTLGEKWLTSDEIADLWYGAGCPQI